jgi:ParB family chromosome partitioning protein
MSATTIHSTLHAQASTTKARFLAPGTHQRADAKGKGKGQGASPAKGPTKTTKARATEAAASAEDEACAAGDLVLIPLSRLVPSAFNVRKSGGEDVGELAALIKAQGLLQNLVVHPDETKRGKSTGDYGVAAGGRRLRALGLLAKAGDIPLDKDILCRLITRDAAIAASVAENSGHAAMSVADTVTAFAEMIAAGAGVEDVAVCFGITPLTVQRRLKLAKVSPVLFELFRQDKINLDQLMALAITDDHAAQERVWNSTPSYNRNPSGLRRLLLGREIDAATDPLARFVGIPAYEAAGGVVVRDLFEDEGSGYITDAELLQRLAVERLTEQAQAFKGEGWAWTEARTSFDHSERQGFGVAAMKQRAPTPEQQAARDALLAAKEEANKGLEDLYDAEDSDDDPGFDSAALSKDASALEAEVEAIDAKLEKLRHDLSEWTADILAFAGVVVALDRNGEVIVHRGMVKPEDRKQAAKAAAAAAGAPAANGATGDTGEGAEPESSANPESLVRKLTSHKTKALQVLMSDNTHVALAALAHTLVQQLVTGYAGGMHRTVSALNLRANDCDSALKGVADDIEASRAWGELASRLDNWRERLPGDADRLLPWLIGQPLDTLLELLALCSALSVSAMSGREADTTGDALAAAVGLDMAMVWTPHLFPSWRRCAKLAVLDQPPT